MSQLAIPFTRSHRRHVGESVSWEAGTPDYVCSRLEAGSGVVSALVWLTLANRPGYAIEVSGSAFPLYIEDRFINQDRKGGRECK